MARTRKSHKLIKSSNNTDFFMNYYDDKSYSVSRVKDGKEDEFIKSLTPSEIEKLRKKGYSEKDLKREFTEQEAMRKAKAWVREVLH